MINLILLFSPIDYLEKPHIRRILPFPLAFTTQAKFCSNFVLFKLFNAVTILPADVLHWVGVKQWRLVARFSMDPVKNFYKTEINGIDTWDTLY